MVHLRAYRRFVVVARQFVPLLLAYARDRRRFLLFGGRRRVSSETRRRRARSLLESMVTLGPTFVKLGQILSTRPDILPPEYVEEFSALQDDVPPADWEGARRVVEADLGPVEEYFDEFDTDAISGASLGQVYRATVDGDPVAVKVRRPGVEELVAADLKVISFWLPVLTYFVDEAQAFSLETLADEFSTIIYEEMDYERERAMLEEIRANFADTDDVRIPRSLESHSGERVLTMEYVGGTKITDVDAIDALGLDRHALAETLQRSYLRMIVDDGVFHGDPHPGNIAVQDDGTLVFYDFGMSGRVEPYVQERIVDFYLAVAEQDIDEILDALIQMGTLSPDADRQVMADVMELAIADARGEDIEHYRVQQIVSRVEDTIYEFPLRLPPNLALVLRVATVVEGVCVTLDPDFDFIDVATDYLRDYGYLEAGAREYVEDRAAELGTAGRAMVRVPPKLEDALDRVNRENLVVEAHIRDENGVMDRLARRLVVALLTAAAAVSTAVVFSLRSLEAAVVPALVTLALAAALYWTFRGKRTIRARPQFTRQQMRQRQRRGRE